MGKRKFSLVGLLFPLDVKACFWHGGCSAKTGTNPVIVKDNSVLFSFYSLRGIIVEQGDKKR